MGGDTLSIEISALSHTAPRTSPLTMIERFQIGQRWQRSTTVCEILLATRDGYQVFLEDGKAKRQQAMTQLDLFRRETSANNTAMANNDTITGGCAVYRDDELMGVVDSRETAGLLIAALKGKSE